MSEIDPKLSRAYREASSEQPPAAIDAAILAAAHERAAQGRQNALRRKRPAWWNWMAPASALATLALGISLALLVDRERPETTDKNLVTSAPQRPQNPARARESAGAAGHAAPAAAEERKDSTTPAAAARPAEAPAAEAISAQPSAKSSARILAAPEAPSDLAGAAARSGLGAAAGKLLPLQQATARSPEDWLEQIKRLQRAGRSQEAAEQLAEFRKTYPGYALPEDLLAK